MAADLVPLRPPVVCFGGGPNRFEAAMVGAPAPAVAYRVPRDTMDPRYAACTDHHVACDCREAELAEERQELRYALRELESAARRALAGHQVQPPLGLDDVERRRYPLCLCSGCVIHRESSLLPFDAVDWETGRVR